MAAKRFLAEAADQQPLEKRIRTRVSFASVIGEVVKVNSLQQFCSALEPMLRRVVNEEVENGLRRCSRSLTRPPSFRIQALEPSNLLLKFSKTLNLPIFTGSKIVASDSNPLKILLVGDQNFSGSIKVEILVLDGDFLSGDRTSWTSEEFESSIVRERSGKRPLLAGDVSITVKKSEAVVGEIELTDNSSWIRSRKFRLGARVVPGSYQGARIREAVTEAFVVKDHRGELYKKHYPPSLDDEVWRLEKVGKDGAFHSKLAGAGITNVQEFLKLSVVDPSKLRKILGPGMSEKTWDVTMKHANTCDKGNKHYVYKESHCTLILNPICQVERVVMNGHVFSTKDVSSIHRTSIENMVRQAYHSWGSLHMFEGQVNETALLTQGEMENHPYELPHPNQVTEKAIYETYPSNRVLYEEDYNNPLVSSNSDWQMTTLSGYIASPGDHVIRYNFTETSSHGLS